MSIEFYSKPFTKSELPFYNGLLGGAGVNTRVAIKVQNTPKLTPMPIFQSSDETPEKRKIKRKSDKKVTKHKRNKIDELLGKDTY